MLSRPRAVDLHVHTVHSDGLLSPAEVIELAGTLRLAAVAITDHDTVEGIESALQAGCTSPVEVVPGVELSAEYDNQEVHILGYWIDHSHDGLNGILESLRQSRYVRAEKIVGRLRALGFPLDYQDVLSVAGGAAPGRLHIARVLVNRGYVESVRTAFEEWLGFSKPAYEERYKLSPQDAVAAVRSAGGIAVLAHPGLTGSIKLLDSLVRWGVRGLEVYHPDHSLLQTIRLKYLALGKKLCITGGSDFHGSETGRTQRLGSCGITLNELRQLKTLRVKVCRQD